MTNNKLGWNTYCTTQKRHLQVMEEGIQEQIKKIQIREQEVTKQLKKKNKQL